MLDINLIRKSPEAVKKLLLKRMDDVDFTEFLQWDAERRELIIKVETAQAGKNEISRQIAALVRDGKEIEIQSLQIKNITNEIKLSEKRLEMLEAEINEFLRQLPNIPDDDVLEGGKENNQTIREYGERTQFAFSPKNHVDLASLHKLIDYEKGTKLSGSGFWIYRGNGAILEWALLNYFIEEHIKDGYEFILPPHILTHECGYAAGQFPKFEDDVYKIENNKNKGYSQFLLPTSETALVNLYRNEILSEDELPLKFFAYTPCYRVEAGSYRASERGMIRGHQFNKVEMFQYTKPEDSNIAFEELLSKAEKLVKGLGLHYKVTKLAARDCSASMAKTYDIEVWIPSMDEYKEVSSVSNAKDYQTRRGMIRFRRNSKKVEFVHTLNASGLATSRIIPAIVEQFQQSDGSILIPNVLQKWVGKEKLQIIGGTERITK